MTATTTPTPAPLLTRDPLAVLADATRRQAGEGLIGFGLGVQP